MIGTEGHPERKISCTSELSFGSIESPNFANRRGTEVLNAFYLACMHLLSFLHLLI